jgi:integrase
MSLGLRQGEALGLRSAYTDLDSGSIKVWWQLQRLGWQHGCDNPHACGERLHKAKPCRPGCKTHATYKRGCPKPCPAGCTGHASTCPKRHGGGLVFTEPKAKSRRIVPIPPPLIPALRDHFVWLARQREEASSLWENHDLLFCQPNGRPIDPRDDWEEFKDLLKEAGIRDSRVHDGRHTAGTLLMEQGVDIRTVMEILGHSQMSVTKRYLHVSTPMAQEAMRRMGDALWEPPRKAEKPRTETETETGSTRVARKKRRRRVV